MRTNGANLSTPCPRLVASGSDGKPTGLWTTQTARNLLMRWNDALAGSGICTPPRAPKANACAERWVRTIIWNERQLRTPLDEHTDHYNAHRPQRGFTRAPNDADEFPARSGSIR